MTIYFDQRAAADKVEEEKKKLAAEAQKKKEKEENIEMGKKLVNALGDLFLSPLVLMLLWNACIPGLFGLASLGYWSAMALYLISRILLKQSKDD